MRGVGFLAGRVDHHEQVVAGVGDHQVVENAAVGVGELGVAGAPLAEAEDVARHQGLEPGGCVGPVDPQLAHVRDVEQPGLGPGVAVLAEDPERELHRHQVAGERHHLAAESLVQRGQRRGLQVLLVGHRSSGDGSATAECRACPLCPKDLRDWPGGWASRLSPSVRRQALRPPPTLQSHLASGYLRLRVSGAVAPSASTATAVAGGPSLSPPRVVGYEAARIPGSGRVASPCRLSRPPATGADGLKQMKHPRRHRDTRPG